MTTYGCRIRLQCRVSCWWIRPPWSIQYTLLKSGLLSQRLRASNLWQRRNLQNHKIYNIRRMTPLVTCHLWICRLSKRYAHLTVGTWFDKPPGSGNSDLSRQVVFYRSCRSTNIETWNGDWLKVFKTGGLSWQWSLKPGNNVRMTRHSLHIYSRLFPEEDSIT